MWLTDDTVKLLDILQIPRFVDLQPTPAHRYIAFLAREGLIEEIITTNYDTCVEKAFQATFNGSALSHPCRQSQTETSDRDDDLVKQYEPCLVITNLNQYRKWSGKTFFEHQRVPRRSLRVYKINGCACHYRYVLENEREESTRRSAAETILLTERQLQHWRERHWARDLFRDRLRSRTLLFSGFGSAEPQVAHTVMQIVEEFERITGDHSNTEQSQCWYKLPNAPFVTAYDADLSFQQVQILYSYARAHYNSTKPTSLANPIDPHASAITGSSASFFHGQPETGGTRTNGGENKLPADLFWKRLYQMVFYKLLSQSCRPGSPAYAYLAPYLRNVDMLIAEMLHWYNPDPEGLPFGQFPSLFEIPDRSSDGVTPFSRWIWTIRYPTKNMPVGWYAPLEEYPVLIPSVLLILFLLFHRNHPSDSRWIDHISCDRGFFVATIPLVSGNVRSESVVSIAHEHVLFEPAICIPDSIQSRVITQIVITNKLEPPRVLPCHNSRSGKLASTVRVYQIPFMHVFQSSTRATTSLDEIKKTFFRNILHPAQLIHAESGALR
ncbi:MAG TPA: hypothetical protein GX517_13885 [Alicyclobacillus sp.]|nr:hypothetical protein [Alicyclobacillus sp.]